MKLSKVSSNASEIKITSLIVASLLSNGFFSATLPVSSANIAEEHFAILTQAHNRVVKRAFIDWSRELWGDPIAVRKGEILHEGVQVGTAQKSWAEICWPNVTSRTWENSVVAISPGKRLVYLLNGEMLFNLDKNRKDKSETLIWTKVLQLRLHGTSVLVQAMSDFTRVAVLEGVVDVTNRYDNSIISLKPGAVYEVRTGPAPTAPAIDSGLAPSRSISPFSSNPGSGSTAPAFGSSSSPAFPRSSSSSGSSSSPSFNSEPSSLPEMFPSRNSGMSNSSSGFSNYESSLSPSDWECFRKLKLQMPGIPEPNKWGPEDYKKFRDTQAYVKQKEAKESEWKQQLQDQKDRWNQQKQWNQQKWQKKSELLDGEQEIEPLAFDKGVFDNLVGEQSSSEFANVNYPCRQGNGSDCKEQAEKAKAAGSEQYRARYLKEAAIKAMFTPACPPSYDSRIHTAPSAASTTAYYGSGALNSAMPMRPIQPKWETGDLAPLGGGFTNTRASAKAPAANAAFAREIVSWNSKPVNLFRTQRSATNVYVADTSALLSHPLMGASFGKDIASMSLIRSSLGGYSDASHGSAGDTASVRNQVLAESVKVLQAPADTAYQIGKELGPNNEMPGQQQLKTSLP